MDPFLMDNFPYLTMATHPSILAGKSHGQRSLVGYNQWGHQELDTTEQQQGSATLHGTLNHHGD